ncbi:hypothetical protein P154DRAFT_583196 [Amniculicola lignicola CBS 123094]|uniref:Uncharacterized protein n=1 Tax=Amniculicola lignicola CBS 123094 TaxID=1392246 RepID=A0A6A5VT97_9PLEO|nr:hypothetical protein P154DRAFT_583196 [Amniculicola lignicola CBS 123094]
MLPLALTLLFETAAINGSPVEHRAADTLNTRAIAAGKQYCFPAMASSATEHSLLGSQTWRISGRPPLGIR